MPAVGLILMVLASSVVAAERQVSPLLQLLLNSSPGWLVSGVSGVSYSTPRRTDITGENGLFLYEPGKSVQFSLGQTILGECVGKKQVSLFDLVAQATIPVGNKEILGMLHDKNNPLSNVLNLAVLLQTIDSDGDPSNGIEITSEVSALFNGNIIITEVDTDQDGIADFRNTSTYQQVGWMYLL